MPKTRNLVGKSFGKWTVIDSSSKRGSRNEVYWLCRCECGTVRDVNEKNMTQGLSKSCGCTNAIGALNKSHGHAANHTISKTYHSWAGMKARCSNPKNSHYHIYGGKGIKVCERWHRFENFLADMGEKPTGASLDRIDPEKDYSPENCRWADAAQQANNKTNNRYITAFGETLTLSQWAERIGVTHGSLVFRIDKAGWPLEKALSTPGRGYGGRKPASKA